jgi:hypothetical protein
MPPRHMLQGALQGPCVLCLALLIHAAMVTGAIAGPPSDAVRFWAAGGIAQGLAHDAETHLAVLVGASHTVTSRFGLGVGGQLVDTHTGGGGFVSEEASRVRVYVLHGRSEYVVWRGQAVSVLITGDLGLGWWGHTTSLTTELGSNRKTERGLHGAIGVDMPYRVPGRRWALLFQVAYHPEVGPDLATPFLTVAIGANRQLW